VIANRRNKHAVSVLNTLDLDANGNPIGLKEDRTNPASANFGTEREPRRGGCYHFSNSAFYLKIDYFNNPTITKTAIDEDGNTVTDFSLEKVTATPDYYKIHDWGNYRKLHDIKIYSEGNLIRWYKLDENSGSIAYDSSGNGNHGTIIDAITVPPEEDPNSVHQYQDIKSYQNDNGYSLDTSGTYPVYIPKDESIALPPFNDVLGNNLEFQGLVGGRASFKGSSCFLGDGTAYLSIAGLLTTDIITVYGDSDIPTCTVGGRLDVDPADVVYGVTIKRSGAVWAIFPMCEPIADPSSHTYYDVSGNENHATLINGTTANEGTQDEYHYLQKGFSGGIKIFEDTDLFPNLSYQVGDRGSYLEFILLPDASVDRFIILKIGGKYVFVADSVYPSTDLYGANFPNTNMWIDDAQFFGTTRGELYTAIMDGNSHKLKVQINTNSLYGDIEFFKYGSVFMYSGYSYDVAMYDSNNAFIQYSKSGGFIPVLNDDTTKDVLNNALMITQDGNSFLDTGTKLEHYNYPAIIHADSSSVWQSGGTFKQLSFDDAKFGGWDNKYYASNKLPELNQIATYNDELKGRQDITEMRVRDTEETVNPNAMVATYRMAAGETLTIPANGSGNDFIMDWGDGIKEHITTINPTHTYVDAGDYITLISGSMSTFNFYNTQASRNNLVSVLQLGNTGLLSLRYSFRECHNLIYFNGAGFDALEVAEISSCFLVCSSLQELYVNMWDVRNIVKAGAFIYGCSALEVVDLSSWVLENAIDMSQFAQSCTSLTSLNCSNFGVGKTTNFYSFVYGCANLVELPVGSWDTSSVTLLDNFANGAVRLPSLDVSNWNVGNVTSAKAFILNCKAIITLDVSNWDVAKVKYFARFASNCIKLETLDVSSWDVSSVLSFSYFVAYDRELTALNISSWSNSVCTAYDSLVNGCTAISELDLRGLNLGANTSLFAFAYGGSNLNNSILGIELIDVSSVADFRVAFHSMEFPTSTYNKILSLSSGWISRGMQSGTYAIDFGNSKYDGTDTDVVDGRNAILAKGWTIIDGGSI